MPRQLNLLEDPVPDPQVWHQLTAEQRTAVVDTIARIIRKAVLSPTTPTTDQPEKAND